jgi:hypothetical protein
MTEPRRGLPLAKRPKDWFFVCFFSFFAFSSFFSDAQHALGRLEGDGFWARANRWYAEVAGDDYLLEDHAYNAVNTGISGFVYGPFYLLLVFAFVRGANWIRPFALVYTGAMLHGMFEFMWWEYAIGPPPRVPLVFWAFNLPYALVPALLAARMWRAAPFGTAEAS